MANTDRYIMGLVENLQNLTGTLSEPLTINGYLSNATLRGIPIELRIQDGTSILQWKYLDEDTWQDLIELNNLNYEELINKPSINDITLIGNLTPEDLGLSTRSEGIATISRNGLTYTVTRPDGSTFSFDQLDQENVIESVSVNGTQLAVSNKNVDVTVPTAVSELTNDSNYTAKSYVDGEISALDAKIDSEISAVSDSIPTAVSELTNDSNYATQSYVDSGIDSIAAAMPTKVSDLTNDSNFTTKTYVDTELAKKQDTLPIESVTAADIGKALMPKTVENGEVTAWEFGEAGMVDDVTINGTSIVNNKVAEIPIASTQLGLIKLESGSQATGLTLTSDGRLFIALANDAMVKGGANIRTPIVPANQHRSTFYGLAKVAGADEKDSTLPLGTYTDAAKTAIQSMLGIDTAIANAVGQITGFDFSVVQELPASGTKGIIYLVAHSHGDNDGYDEYIWINDGFEKLGHCDIDLSNYVTFDDYATAQKSGVVKVGNNSTGIQIDSGYLAITPAVQSEIKTAANVTLAPIIPGTQHISAFYGLAKAAGDSTQSASANAVGTYTDDAKSAIQSMLGVPADDEVVKDVQINGTSIVSNGAANIPIASDNDFGVVRITQSNGVSVNANGFLKIEGASLNNETKQGSNTLKPITPFVQHWSTFYGLAKAAGDTTMTSSSNSVGTYTIEAKTAIQTMLGIPDEIAAALANYEESSSTITNAQIDALFI